MSTVSTFSIGAPGTPGAGASGVSTPSISTPSIHVSDTSYHGVTQTVIDVSGTSASEAQSHVTYGASVHLDHGASFWVA